MGSVVRPVNEETKHASRFVVLKLVRVIPLPILHYPDGANHAGFCRRTSMPIDDAYSAKGFRKRKPTSEYGRRVRGGKSA